MDIVGVVFMLMLYIIVSEKKQWDPQAALPATIVLLIAEPRHHTCNIKPC